MTLREQEVSNQRHANANSWNAEMEFYRNVAQQVADNLLHFVDGKFVNGIGRGDDECIPRGRNSHQQSSGNKQDKSSLIDDVNSGFNFDKYNFPTDFRDIYSPLAADTLAAECDKKADFLLESCDLKSASTGNVIELLDEKTEDLVTEKSQVSSDVEKKSVYVCSACHERISSSTLKEHEANNHPNVYCTYVEIDAAQHIPSKLLVWQYHRPEGLLKRCRVPVAPTTSRDDDHLDKESDDSVADRNNNHSLICTKCHQSFASVGRLHQHILDCAHSKDNTSNKEGIKRDSKDISKESNTVIIQSSNGSKRKSSPPLSFFSSTSTTSSSRNKSPSKSPSPNRPVTRGRRRLLENSQQSQQSCQSQESQQLSEQSKSKRAKPSETTSRKTSKKSEDNDEDLMNLKKFITEIDAVERRDYMNDLSVRRHSQQKRYSCQKCEKRFTFLESLEKHHATCSRAIFQSTKVKKLKKIHQTTKPRKKLTSTILKVKAMKGVLAQQQTENKREPIKLTIRRESKEICKIQNDESTEEEECEDEVEDKVEEDSTAQNCQAKVTIDKSKSPRRSRSSNSSTSPTTPTTSAAANNPYLSINEHRCPDCLRVFTYMANFRKHIKNVCPVRRQSGDGNAIPTPVTSEPLATSTPANKNSNTVTRDSVNKEAVDKQEDTKESECKNEDNNEKHISNSESNNDNLMIIVNIVSVEGDNLTVAVEKAEVVEMVSDENQEPNNNKKVKSEEDVDEEVLEAENAEEVEELPLPDDSKLDLWRIKQEHPTYAFKGSPAQHHSCPYCQRGFTYLANYRKHIKSICPIRQQIEEKKKKVMNDSDSEGLNGDLKTLESPTSTRAFVTPTLSVRSQIEDTVLTLLRDQTKQHEIIHASEEMESKLAAENGGKTVDGAQNSEIEGVDGANLSSDTQQNGDGEGDSGEAKSRKDSGESNNGGVNDSNNNDGKAVLSNGKKGVEGGRSFRFRSFSCSICHKIFLSYVMMLKHRLSHKLSDISTTTNNNDNNNNKSCEDKSDCLEPEATAIETTEPLKSAWN